MKYTLITGASRGIGESMAEYAASKGYNLILVARSEEKLQESASYLQRRYRIDVKVKMTDLLEGNAVEDLYQWVNDNNLNVDKLINNAGIGMYGKFEQMSLEDQLNVIKLNQIVTVKMCHSFLPMLQQNKPAFLMNVASTACYQPIPYMSVYAATQSFIQSFTLGLREELKRAGVGVSCLNPGPTATDFFERAGLQSMPVNSAEIKMSAREVAEVAIEGMLDKVAEIIPGTSNTLGAYFSKLFPNRWVVRTVSGLFSPRTTA